MDCGDMANNENVLNATENIWEGGWRYNVLFKVIALQVMAPC